MIGKVIHTLLTADATVIGLVGDKVFPVIVPQNTAFPAVTYETTSSEPIEVIGWQKIADTVNVQINVFAERYTTAIDIKEAIKAVLDFKHQFASNGLDVCGITPRNDMDGTHNEELNLYHRILTYEISINQPYQLG